MKLLIENMTCGGCARGVTATIHEIDPNAKVDIDLATKVVSVESAEIIDNLIKNKFGNLEQQLGIPVYGYLLDSL